MTIETKFAQTISKIVGEDPLLKIRGSTLLVEILPDHEIKTSGGLVMATDARHVRGSLEEHKLRIGYVIATGEGYTMEDGVTLPLDVKPGSIVFLPKYAVSPISVFPGLNKLTEERVAMIKEDQVLAYYPTVEAYEKAVTVMSAE